MISTAGVKRDKLFLSHENEDASFFVPRIVFPGMKLRPKRLQVHS